MSGKRLRKAEGSGVGNDSVPPAYGDYEGPQIDEETESQLRAAFYNLNLGSDASPTPLVDTCLAHLKLLRAFEDLKSRVGHSDGLWDIWDSRAQNAGRGGPGRSTDALEILVKLREKRWAVYVARAVDRYEAWWKSFVPVMLTESDMFADGKEGQLSRFEGFTSKREPMIWTSNSLPPAG
ncbi:Alpha-ketoglutarate-dependent sulfonate dioxygenase [Apiospora kogelbergensis]|uniref:Alpha-ketoglutarate-dependent sulfonate dioxygenase n=1 Tax=Apiospora kogelbergensis TaxID=1337665 RepID=A0AAW0QSU8_9PEZI